MTKTLLIKNATVARACRNWRRQEVFRQQHNTHKNHKNRGHSLRAFVASHYYPRFFGRELP